jgi:putative tricarboxylic transport membrane protein
VGAYSIQNNPVHISWALGFGLIGYLLKRYGFQVGPIILGVILGPLIDANYRRAMIGAHQDVGQFFYSLISNPISLILTIALLAILVSQLPLSMLRARSRR